MVPDAEAQLERAGGEGVGKDEGRRRHERGEWKAVEEELRAGGREEVRLDREKGAEERDVSVHLRI